MNKKRSCVHEQDSDLAFKTRQLAKVYIEFFIYNESASNISGDGFLRNQLWLTNESEMFILIARLTTRCSKLVRNFLNMRG